MMQKLKAFVIANKVFFTGLLGAVTLVIQQYASTPTGGSVDWKTIGFAALVAVLGYVSNQWRGAGVTIVGIIGSIAGVIATSLQNHQAVNLSQLILFALVAIGSAVAPPPKPQTYETSPVIEQAKS